MKESDFQQSVCQFLDVACPEVLYFHVCNSSIMAQVIINLVGPEKGKIIIAKFVNFLKKIGLKPGVPDLVLCYAPKQVVFLECKSGIGKLSEDQKNVHNRLTRFGWRVYIIRSIPDLRSVIRIEGIPCRESKNAGKNPQ